MQVLYILMSSPFLIREACHFGTAPLLKTFMSKRVCVMLALCYGIDTLLVQSLAPASLPPVVTSAPSCRTMGLSFGLLYRPSTGTTWELDRQSAATLQQLMPSLDNNQLKGPLGSAIAAVMSSDPKLRQAVLQGACFFALAAGKAGHGRSEAAQEDAPQQQSQLGSQEAQAEDVVALVETSMQKVVEEVRFFCAVQKTATRASFMQCMRFVACVGC